MRSVHTKFLKKSAIAFFAAVLMAFTGYYLLALYYRNGFSVNTWVNGVYCTGKSVEEVNQELLSQAEAPVVVVIDSGNEAAQRTEIDFAKIGFSLDYTGALKEYLDNQNPFLWIDNLSFEEKNMVKPHITYNGDAFLDAFLESDAVKRRLDEDDAVYRIGYDEDEGWFFYDGLKDRFSADLAFRQAKAFFEEHIYEKEIVIDLAKLECTYSVEPSADDRSVRELWDKIEKFLDFDLVYDMGAEKFKIEKSELSAMLKRERGDVYGITMDYPVLDGDGKLIIDEKEVEAYVVRLCEAYDTYGKTREFQSTKGELIHVPAYGNYGTELDRKTETAFLKKCIKNPDYFTGADKVHIPEYLHQGYVRGLDDIGGTYIEVDMTDQRMYFYQDGELIIDTDVVTGDLVRGRETPQGVYYIYFKQLNRVLHGVNYTTRVNYWMAVIGGVGIHDAVWRDSFGGDIYVNDGSHGCINTPIEKVSELYELAEVGTPVVMFYSHEQ